MQLPWGEEESQLGGGAAGGRQEGEGRKEKLLFICPTTGTTQEPCDVPPPLALPKLILEELTPNTCPAPHPRCGFMSLQTAEMGTNPCKAEAQQSEGVPAETGTSDPCGSPGTELAQPVLAPGPHEEGNAGPQQGQNQSPKNPPWEGMAEQEPH